VRRSYVNIHFCNKLRLFLLSPSQKIIAEVLLGRTKNYFRFSNFTITYSISFSTAAFVGARYVAYLYLLTIPTDAEIYVHFFVVNSILECSQSVYNVERKYFLIPSRNSSRENVF
jgi:hypothetical protein